MFTSAQLEAGILYQHIRKSRVHDSTLLQVLTYYALWEVYRNTHGSIGNQRLTKMVQQKEETNVRINFVPEHGLDKWVAVALMVVHAWQQCLMNLLRCGSDAEVHCMHMRHGL